PGLPHPERGQGRLLRMHLPVAGLRRPRRAPHRTDRGPGGLAPTRPVHHLDGADRRPPCLFGDRRRLGDGVAPRRNQLVRVRPAPGCAGPDRPARPRLAHTPKRRQPMSNYLTDQDLTNIIERTLYADQDDALSMAFELQNYRAQVRAGWRPPARVITDPAELDALGGESIVIAGTKRD